MLVVALPYRSRFGIHPGRTAHSFRPTYTELPSANVKRSICPAETDSGCSERARYGSPCRRFDDNHCLQLIRTMDVPCPKRVGAQWPVVCSRSNHPLTRCLHIAVIENCLPASLSRSHTNQPNNTAVVAFQRPPVHGADQLPDRRPGLAGPWGPGFRAAEVGRCSISQHVSVCVYPRSLSFSSLQKLGKRHDVASFLRQGQCPHEHPGIRDTQLHSHSSTWLNTCPWSLCYSARIRHGASHFSINSVVI